MQAQCAAWVIQRALAFQPRRVRIQPRREHSRQVSIHPMRVSIHPRQVSISVTVKDHSHQNRLAIQLLQLLVSTLLKLLVHHNQTLCGQNDIFLCNVQCYQSKGGTSKQSIREDHLCTHDEHQKLAGARFRSRRRIVSAGISLPPNLTLSTGSTLKWTAKEEDSSRNERSDQKSTLPDPLELNSNENRMH